MALTTYCALEEVRAALGVNDEELPDAVLTLPIYEIGLVRELNKISTSLPGAFSTSVNTTEGTRTPPQQLLIDAVRLFASFVVAQQAGAPLGMLAPKDVGDGKATLSRFSDSPYKDALERVEKLANVYRANLAAAFDALTGSTTGTSSVVPATFFLASKRSYDPVTGA